MSLGFQMLTTQIQHMHYLFFITYLIGSGILHLTTNEYQNIIIATMLIGTLSLMLIFRKRIKRLTYRIE